MIKSLSVFFLLFLFFSSFAGEKTITILAGPSINTIIYRDEAVSSLTDQNAIFGFLQAFQIQSDKRIEQISLSFQSGTLYNSKSSANPVFNKITIEYYRIWYLWQKNKNYTGVGLNLHTGNSTTMRSEFPNNPSYNCFLTTFSPAFRAERRIINKKEKSVVFNLTNTFTILSYIIRPSLGTVSPIDYSGNMSQSTGDYYSSGKFAFIDKLQAFTFSAAIDFNLSRRFVFSIGYNWYYVHYSVDPEYYEVNHQIFTYVGFKF